MKVLPYSMGSFPSAESITYRYFDSILEAGKFISLKAYT
jgi:hypothetical protein